MLRNVVSAFAAAVKFPPLHTACAVYFFSILVYRIALAIALQWTEAAPLGAPKGALAILAITAGLGNDILIAAVFCLLVVFYRFFRELYTQI